MKEKQSTVSNSVTDTTNDVKIGANPAANRERVTNPISLFNKW